MSPTRRDFLFTSAAAAAAASLARVANLHAAQGPQAAPPVFMPIRRNVGFFTMRGGTIGYLINAGGVAVVDPARDALVRPAPGRLCRPLRAEPHPPRAGVRRGSLGRRRRRQLRR